MKFKTRIKKIMFLTEENKKIEVELSEEALYFIEFNLLDEDKEKVKLDSEQLNLEEEINEKQICYECKYIEQKPNEYPCYNCINNRTIYNVNNFFEEKQDNENNK